MFETEQIHEWNLFMHEIVVRRKWESAINVFYSTKIYVYVCIDTHTQRYKCVDFVNENSRSNKRHFQFENFEKFCPQSEYVCIWIVSKATVICINKPPNLLVFSILPCALRIFTHKFKTFRVVCTS